MRKEKDGKSQYDEQDKNCIGKTEEKGRRFTMRLEETE
jgi:hypothetical protein